MGVIPELGAGQVGALQSGIGMATAAGCFLEVFFKIWALGMVLQCHQECLYWHWAAWMDQLLSVCSSLPLRQRECCFWSVLTHISALFPSLSPVPMVVPQHQRI